MPTEIKLWQIENQHPRAIPQDRLALESRLEHWLREDIGLVSNDLLLIGQQVQTAYGGSIDLLAINSDGDLVILELKRDKTPRDIVAQVLDYASWAQTLSHDLIKETFSNFSHGQSLEAAFRTKFQTDLPDVLNERHRMYIVASALDSATERIVKYLSETHGVDLNVATFAYFKTENGEYLGRSFLLDDVVVQTRAESTSKRKPALSLDEFRQIAETNSVVDLYDKALSLKDLFSSIGRTRSSIILEGRVASYPRPVAILAIYPEGSSAEDGLAMLCLAERASEYFGLPEEKIRAACGSPATNFPSISVYPEQVYYFDALRLDQLIELLGNASVGG